MCFNSEVEINVETTANQFANLENDDEENLESSKKGSAVNPAPTESPDQISTAITTKKGKKKKTGQQEKEVEELMKKMGL